MFGKIIYISDTEAHIEVPKDGTISTKGCIFCSEKGSGELIRCGSGNSIVEKIKIYSTVYNSSFSFFII